MKLSPPVLLIVAAVALVAGCGTDDDPQAKVKAAVHAFVDDNRCDVMSDRNVAQGYASAREGRRACEAQIKAGDVGIEKGQYEITRVAVGDDRATATLALDDGGQRVYRLVKGGPVGWQVDGLTERFLTRVGKPLRYRDTTTIDSADNAIDARVTVRSVKAAPGEVSAAVEIASLARKPFEFSVLDFSVLDRRGNRHVASGRPGLLQIAPGKTARGTVSFRLPPGATATEVRLRSRLNEDSAPLRWKLS